MSDTPRYNNAIWIFSDQQPAHMLSCSGNPNLNALDHTSIRRETYQKVRP